MSKIFCLSGAGLSAESGISTFRDAGGLWENHDVMEICSTQGWQKNKQNVTRFYDQRRQDLSGKEPNKMHFFLADLEKKYKQEFIHLTQNVDDLCEKAGAKNVIHLHGSLRDLRCEKCGATWDIGYAAQDPSAVCKECGSRDVRHNVVMFGESAPNYKYIYSTIARCEIFIAIGTSGKVIDIVPLAVEAPKSIYINIKREEYYSLGNAAEWIDGFFTDAIIKPASQATQDLADLIDFYANEDGNF
ncbi:MAG: SIR2 family NAD-dependent protein deacylase [Helicobacteraceae bacterium]